MVTPATASTVATVPKPATPHVVIIGGGPCGLGAASRLADLGVTTWTLREKSAELGGLASSWKDDKGFTYDYGIHCFFSHYEYVSNLLLKVPTTESVRKVFILPAPGSELIPYPLQNYIHRLPEDVHVACLKGLTHAAIERAATGGTKPPADFATFADWLLHMFGRELCDFFMYPYNQKVWAISPEKMQARWVGERVAVPDLDKTLELATRNPATDSQTSWGPNAKFNYPTNGGIGAFWEGVANGLPQQNVRLNSRVEKIDVERKIVFYADGSSEKYDKVISTLALDHIVNKVIEWPATDAWQQRKTAAQDAAAKLVYSHSHILGVGVKGKLSAKLREVSWFYFQADDAIFYRVAILSNYSPNMVPDSDNDNYYCIDVEMSEAKDGAEIGTKYGDAKQSESTLTQQVIEDLRKYGLIESEHEVVATSYRKCDHGYPTPHVNRDAALDVLQPILLEHCSIYSRGRFGGWKYEAGNMDHSAMQGVEAVDHLLREAGGNKADLVYADQLTYFKTNVVNDPKNWKHKTTASAA